jgi:hypothetical protein
VEVFKQETREIIRRFRGHKLSATRCIALLDDAFLDFSSRATADQIEQLRAIVLANNEIVMAEMERRSALAQREPSTQDITSA